MKYLATDTNLFIGGVVVDVKECVIVGINNLNNACNSSLK